MDINSNTCILTGPLFAASNSENGFKSYYREIFDGGRYKKRYIIKGGPGTGKSSFMRLAASEAQKRGMAVEYYRCSSDPDSLDAVIIEGHTVILDGTAPHTLDCEVAGARDELIDLGAFWDSRQLALRIDEIEDLSKRKSESYRLAYRYLSLCGQIRDVNDGILSGALNVKKLDRAVQRLLGDLPEGDGYNELPGLCSSVGIKGQVRFDTYESSAEKLYYVNDWFFAAHHCLNAILIMAKKKKQPVRISYDPISSKRLNCVYFCNLKMAFIAQSTERDELCEAPKINMKRFIDVERLTGLKKDFRKNSKISDMLLKSATDSLSKAGESHFALEKIYSSCMDFSAKEHYSISFVNMMLDRIEQQQQQQQ